MLPELVRAGFRGVPGLTVVLDFAPTAFNGITPDDRYALLAVAWLLIAVLTLIWGIGLWVRRWDAIEQSLKFLAFLSWVVVAIFWVFSLCLGAINHYLVPSSWPLAFRPRDATWLSLGAFVLTGIYLVARFGWRRLLPGERSQ